MGHDTLHGSTHEDGGVDEFSVEDLSGELADPQKQKETSISIDDAYTYSSSWTEVVNHIFRGTDEMGTPTNIKLLLYEGGVGATATLNVRIVDRDNGDAVICSQSAVSPATYPNASIVDMGTLSNLPTSEHRLAVEIQKASGGANRYVGIRGGQIQW